MDFSQKSIVEVNHRTEPMTAVVANQYLLQTADWTLENRDGEFRLLREFALRDADQAKHFAQIVRNITEAEPYLDNPAITVEDNRVTILWWTEAIHGLHINDFVMAARTNDIYERMEEVEGRTDAVTEASYESFPASDAPSWT